MLGKVILWLILVLAIGLLIKKGACCGVSKKEEKTDADKGTCH